MHINAILDHSFSENEDNAPFREISGIKLTKIGATFTVVCAHNNLTSVMIPSYKLQFVLRNTLKQHMLCNALVKKTIITVLCCK